MTTEVTAEKYLSFDDDAEMHEREVSRAQNDWRKTTRARCIQDVKFDLGDNLIDVGNEESDEEIEEVLVDQPKPAKV